MRILFLHPNFPGQFVRPALLAASQGHDVRFLCQTHHNRRLPGVQRLALKGGLGHEALEARRLDGHSRAMALADQFREGMEQLRDGGWEPELVVSHSGWGCGLHSSVVWPKARRIAYVEWWFAPNADLYGFAPQHRWWPGPGDGLALRDRNLTVALELSEAHVLLAPTQWQRNQLPDGLRKRCIVVSDGVDRERYKPAPELRHSRPLLTYGTRGMEPMRGFTEFIEELPTLLDKRQDLEVEIAGEDRICYGGKPPAEGSFGRWAALVLKPWIEAGRVRFLGRLEPNDYLRWLQRSWIHVYLTRPFVASWSLAEAMACGCSIVASDTPPVHEFTGASGNPAAQLVDFRVTGWLIEAVDSLLGCEMMMNELRARARSQSANWSMDNSRAMWSRVING